MSTPHSGAPPGPDVKRGARVGPDTPRKATAGEPNRTPPSHDTQRRALPFGAYRLLEKRYRGLAPIGNLFVALGRNLGKHYDWRIVVGPDDDTEALDLTVVAGLSVIIGGRDQARVDAIAQAVGRFKPKRMIAVDYSTGRIMVYAPEQRRYPTADKPSPP